MSVSVLVYILLVSQKSNVYLFEKGIKQAYFCYKIEPTRLMFPSKASVARNLILNFSLFLVSCESCEPMVETPQSYLPSSSPRVD